MADDKVEPRETNWRQLLPWTVLFQGFRVALDPNKLVLAAAGYPLILSQGELQQFINSQPEADRFKTRVWVLKQHVLRPAGKMRTWPWKESRGPNPFLLATRQTSSSWDKGQFWDWLLLEQLPVL